MGEDGVGRGLTKEYFMELFKELLDPKHNLFKVYSKTYIWFKDSKFYENIKVFEEIGIICGLAISNHVTMDLPFPLALFKVYVNVKVIEFILLKRQ